MIVYVKVALVFIFFKPHIRFITLFIFHGFFCCYLKQNIRNPKLNNSDNRKCNSEHIKNISTFYIHIININLQNSNCEFFIYICYGNILLTSKFTKTQIRYFFIHSGKYYFFKIKFIA